MGVRSSLLRSAEFFAQILPLSIKQAIYRNQFIARLLRSSLNLAAPQGLSEVKIAAGRAKNLQMELDLKSEKDYWLGTYEAEVQQAIVDLVKPGDIIYDVGANIGFLTLLFARTTGATGHVYAFEALPANVFRLSHNVEINGFQEWVTVVPVAVLDRSGEVEFLIGPSTGMGKVGGSLGRDSVEYNESINVEGLSIDEYVERRSTLPADIVKIDIEGGEVLALPGMQKLIHDQGPIIMIELHGPEAAKTTWKILNREQYRICLMAPSFPEVHEVNELGWKSYVVAFPND